MFVRVTSVPVFEHALLVQVLSVPVRIVMLRSVFIRMAPVGLATAGRFTNAFATCDKEENASTRDGGAPIAARTQRLKPNQKIVHLVRHAQGHHNVAGAKDPIRGYLREDLEDALLTDFGKEQCYLLRDSSSELLKYVDLVVVSPLNRTIETALHSFPFLVNKVPWVAREEIRETIGVHPCDRRTSITRKKHVFPTVDFSGIVSDEDDSYYRFSSRETPAEIAVRGKHFLQWLKTRPEREIVVVTHSGFLLTFLEDVLRGSAEELGESFQEEFFNAELRTYVVTL